MISVIVPAHNEETVIRRCLHGLIEGSRPNELEIIVVCNGCTDRTAEIARAVGPPVRVFETPSASKCQALNLGDAQAKGFPRWYVDADLGLSIDAIRKVSAKMTKTGLLAAAPRLRVDTSHRNWFIRSYYGIWTKLPYVANNLVGSGVYALSQRGRMSFCEFPEVHADDAYVRLLFDEPKRAAVEDAEFTVFPPKTLRSLIRIRARRLIGMQQMRSLLPDHGKGERAKQRLGLVRLCGHPRHWPGLCVYVSVRFASQALYEWKYRLLGRYDWERDESTRV
jgi:glycosyltransferase involved in cell wall biosynthesis